MESLPKGKEMKALDEVISTMEYEATYNSGEARDYDADTLYYLKDMKNLAEDYDILYNKYWREYNQQQANPALTWDELRTMEGKPVWVEYNLQIGDKEFRDKSKRWCIVREFKPWHDTEIIITENGFVLSKNEQIKYWQAYRKENNGK